MTFLAGPRLWLFVGLAALVALYVLRQAQRRRYAVRFTNIALLDAVAPCRPGWRRHLSAGALMLASASLLTAFARPARASSAPVPATTVVLAIDVSGSMAATDIAPDRLRAAQVAATSFVDGLPAAFNVGLVAFDDTASVLAAPTTDHAQVRGAIGGLQVRGGTAIGEAIYAALHSVGVADGPAPTGPPGTAPAAGGPVPAHIVLMSDGATNSGRPDDEAAHAASAAHVPITTIAYGTDSGRIASREGVEDVPVDRFSLQQIADETGGRSFEAASASQLGEVYKTIRTSVSHRTRRRDISSWFVGTGLALLGATAVGSLRWSPHLP
ncbi:MAG TPA: VWA domain-containing protein [Acidimicrobiales bacterium]|nr:VWA domain-containing protein [Acidimicrobiales bacterium]